MPRHTRIGAAWGAATLAALMLLSAAPASAHNYLVASTPEEGEVLTTLPEEFSVTTNETLLDLAGDSGGFAIQVTDEAGKHFGDGCFTIRDETLATGASLGEPGEYLMRWQLVSADGHPISGEVGFTWQPNASLTAVEGLDAPPACGGGTLDDAAPSDENRADDQGATGDQNATDDAGTEVDSTADASTVVFTAAAVALVLMAAVAVFLLSMKRKRDEE
ncbi:Copper resistance protein CopC [Leifsonia rubra CMS 76R]|nr:Copper resistance protein CopC [Leifsonia rubra CMS 76R]